MEMLAVGVVTATHGLKGELTVRSFSGRIDHLGRLRGVLLRRGAEERRVTVLSVRAKPPHAVMKLEGVDSPEKAQGFSGLRDLGSALRGGAPGGRGVLRGGPVPVQPVLRAGAPGQRPLGRGCGLLADARGGRAGGKAFLVPFIDHFVGEVDVQGGRIELRERGIVP